MKKFLLMLLLVSIPAKAIEKDKYLHAGVSFGLNTLGYVGLKQAGLNTTEALLLSAVATSTVGIVKELYDKRFDSGDVVSELASRVLKRMVPVKERHTEKKLYKVSFSIDDTST